MRELERSMAEKFVHRPPYKVIPSEHLQLCAGEKGATIPMQGGNV